MHDMKRTILVPVLVAIVAAAAVGARQSPEAELLRATDPPPHGIWLDSLDMSRITATVIRSPRGGGPGRGTGREGAAPAAPAAPPAPPVYALGGVTYPHTVPMQSDRDLSVDLKGQAVRFASMVGIDSSAPCWPGKRHLRRLG